MPMGDSLFTRPLLDEWLQQQWTQQQRLDADIVAKRRDAAIAPMPGDRAPFVAPGSGQGFVTRDKRLGWARVCRITGKVTGLYPYEAGKEPNCELRSEHLVPLVADPRSG